MNWPTRTRDYLFAQDLKLRKSLQIFYYAILPLSHMFSTTNLYWHRRESFCTRHHLIFVLINRELLRILGKKEEKCECDWASLANGMVGWVLYVVWPLYTCPATLNCCPMLCFKVAYWSLPDQFSRYHWIASIIRRLITVQGIKL